MTEAQSLFDKAAGPCCPHQLASPVLHRVLQFKPIADHVWGGKGVGSQVPSRKMFCANGSSHGTSRSLLCCRHNPNERCCRETVRRSCSVEARQARQPCAGS